MTESAEPVPVAVSMEEEEEPVEQPPPPLTFDEARALGVSALERGQLQEAVEYLTKAIELDPHHMTLFTKRGAALFKLNRFEEALRDSIALIEMSPASPTGYARKGLCLHCLGRFGEAAQAFLDGLKVAPENAVLRKGFEDAMAQLRLGRHASSTTS